MLSYEFMGLIRAVAVSMGELYNGYVLPITAKGNMSANKYLTMHKTSDSQHIGVCGKCLHDFNSHEVNA